MEYCVEVATLRYSARASSFQLEGARFVPHEAQIRRRLRMTRIQRERALVIQDRFAEISEPKPGVAQVVKQVRAPLPGSTRSW